MFHQSNPLIDSLHSHATVFPFKLSKNLRSRTKAELGRCARQGPVVERRGRHLPLSRYVVEGIDKISDLTFSVSRSKVLLSLAELILTHAVVPLRADLFTGPARSVCRVHQDLQYTSRHFSERSLTIWCSINTSIACSMVLYPFQTLSGNECNSQARSKSASPYVISLEANTILVTVGEQLYKAIFPIGCIVLAFRYRLSTYRSSYRGK